VDRETSTADAPPGFAHARRVGRRDPTARAVIARWRWLTGGRDTADADRGTLVACSGGADSSALACALAAAPAPITIAHVRHDMRSPEESAADEAHARRLADFLARPFVRADARTADTPGNAEANARRTRYARLGALARDAGLPFVATGHHADDQLETVLMRLLRGAGPRGLAGIRPRRRLDDDRTLVRPMLVVTAADARELLRRHAVPWAEDRSNADTTRLRAALRSQVLPALYSIRPAGARAAVAAAEQLAAADLAIRAAAAAVPTSRPRPGVIEWPRADLSACPPAVIAEALRAAAESSRPAARRATPTRAELDAAIRAIKLPDRASWSGRLGAGALRVTAHAVTVLSA